MELRELDRTANSDESIDESMSLIEYAYCAKMRNLYNEFKSGRIDIYICKIRKQELIKEYKETLFAYETWCSDHKAYQDNIRQTDTLRSDICKSDNIYVIADLAVKALMLMTGDTVVYKIFKDKFKEK